MTKQNIGRWPKVMQNCARFWMLGAAIAALLAGGCAGTDTSKSQRLDDFLHAPEFLTSPMSVLLTNTPSFSARIAVSEYGRSKLGQVLGNGNHLIFAQDLPKGSAKRHRYEQSSFIWNVSEGKGYVLNDPLQGYAPVSAPSMTTGPVESANSGISEDIDGHHCRRVSKTIALNDGTTATYTVWEATDLKGFPVRIKSGNGQLVIEFSKIRLEEIPLSLFSVQDGFQKFNSPEIMTSELLERELRMKNKGAGEWNKTPAEFQSPGGINRQNNPYGPE